MGSGFVRTLSSLALRAWRRPWAAAMSASLAGETAIDAAAANASGPHSSPLQVSQAISVLGSSLLATTTSHDPAAAAAGSVAVASVDRM